MTERELNRVRELRKNIRDLERHLQALRISAADLVPVLDGLPRPSEVKSRVERLALEIVAYEGELTALRETMAVASMELSEYLRGQVEDLPSRTVLFLRYVVCMPFRDIAFQLEMSDRKVYSLHHDALLKICS